MAIFEHDVVVMYKIRAFCDKCRWGELFPVESQKDLRVEGTLHCCKKCGEKEVLSKVHPRYQYKREK